MRLWWGKRRLAVARTLALVAPVVRRQVGTCGSCGGPVLLDPGAGHAVCPCGDCRLPKKFLRPGETA